MLSLITQVEKYYKHKKATWMNFKLIYEFA